MRLASYVPAFWMCGFQTQLGDQISQNSFTFCFATRLSPRPSPKSLDDIGRSRISLAPVARTSSISNKGTSSIVGHQSYQMTPSGICKHAPGVKKGTATSGMDKFTQNAPTTGSTSSPAHRSSIVVCGHVQTQSPCRRQGRQFPTARDSTFWWQGQSQPQSSRAMWQFAIFFVFVLPAALESDGFWAVGPRNQSSSPRSRLLTWFQKSSSSRRGLGPDMRQPPVWSGSSQVAPAGMACQVLVSFFPMWGRPLQGGHRGDF